MGRDKRWLESWSLIGSNEKENQTTLGTKRPQAVLSTPQALDIDVTSITRLGGCHSHFG